jgi:hypothetical protein
MIVCSGVLRAGAVTWGNAKEAGAVRWQEGAEGGTRVPDTMPQEPTDRKVNWQPGIHDRCDQRVKVLSYVMRSSYTAGQRCIAELSMYVAGLCVSPLAGGDLIGQNLMIVRLGRHAGSWAC